MSLEFGGKGGKRPQLNLSINNLFLDSENPRLKSNHIEEIDIIREHAENSKLEELAASLEMNGFFDEEPIVAVPRDLPEKFKNKTYDELTWDYDYVDFIYRTDTQFTVVEGNRRLASIKILLIDEIRKQLKLENWPIPELFIKEDLSTLPAIIYTTRLEVMPYLAYRHSKGVSVWSNDEYEKYIEQMLAKGYSRENIEMQFRLK